MTVRRGPGLILRNFSFLAAAQLFFRLSYFVVVAIMARVLPINEYAAITLIIVYVGLWAPIFNFGLGIIGVREMAQGAIDSGAFVGRLLILKMLVSLLGWILLLATGLALGYGDRTSFFVLAAIGGSTVLVSLAEFFHLPFTADERMGTTAFLVMAERALVGLGGVMGLLLWVGGGEGFALGQMLGGGVAAGVAYWVWRRSYGPLRLSVSGKEIAWYVREAWPVAANWAFAIGYGRLGAVILGAVSSAIEVASFNSAFFLLMSAQMMVMVMMHALYPALSRAGGRERDLIRRNLEQGLRGLSVAAVLLVPIGVAIAGPVVVVALGATLRRTADVLEVLLWVIPLFALNNLIGSFLQATARQVVVAKATAYGLAANCLANLALAPSLGGVGVAIAHFVSELVILAYLARVIAVQDGIGWGGRHARLPLTALAAVASFLFLPTLLGKLVTMLVVAPAFLLAVGPDGRRAALGLPKLVMPGG